ncbi:hypothetical protein [Streptomyces phaeochromogenes]|uniref:hypothetical protein n=1 Tax=Streptomyces phaeochromogenes TaxID=1923 RepID=UPI0006E15A2D|nr:hypothetical protein [Streptomyces phaeochromogenes]
MADERLLALKERAAAQLMRIPGVTGVGLGGRERAGRPTGEIVLKVFVRRKRPLAELTPSQTLPPQFEGVGVDVSELSYPAPDTDPLPPEDPLTPGASTTTNFDWDTKRYRPLVGGGRLQADVISVGRGTLGCLLVHSTDPSKVYALTNYHVVAAIVAGQLPVVNVTRVGHPGLTPSPVKNLSAGIGVFAGGGLDTIRDAALVQLDVGTKWRAEIVGIGPVTGPYKVTVEDARTLAYQVRKRGARTRLTGGIVESVNTTITSRTDGVLTTRNNVLVVKPNPNPTVRAGGTLIFSDGGDSGSVVVNDNAEVVALHYGSDEPVPGVTVRKGCALPIDEILERFQDLESLPVQLATATKNGQVRVVPKAQPSAAPTEPGMAVPAAPAER